MRTRNAMIATIALAASLTVGACGDGSARGGAGTNVTWEDIAAINADHARENAGVTKAAALELLRRNSRRAADAVRAFTDEELDRAAPFSLSYGAPVTAQFVVEDHALRHSWHHLYRIRARLVVLAESRLADARFASSGSPARVGGW